MARLYGDDRRTIISLVPILENIFLRTQHPISADEASGLRVHMAEVANNTKNIELPAEIRIIIIYINRLLSNARIGYSARDVTRNIMILKRRYADRRPKHPTAAKRQRRKQYVRKQQYKKREQTQEDPFSEYPEQMTATEQPTEQHFEDFPEVARQIKDFYDMTPTAREVDVWMQSWTLTKPVKYHFNAVEHYDNWYNKAIYIGEDSQGVQIDTSMGDSRNVMNQCRILRVAMTKGSCNRHANDRTHNVYLYQKRDGHTMTEYTELKVISPTSNHKLCGVACVIYIMSKGITLLEDVYAAARKYNIRHDVGMTVEEVIQFAKDIAPDYDYKGEIKVVYNSGATPYIQSDHYDYIFFDTEGEHYSVVKCAGQTLFNNINYPRSKKISRGEMYIDFETRNSDEYVLCDKSVVTIDEGGNRCVSRKTVQIPKLIDAICCVHYRKFMGDTYNDLTFCTNEDDTSARQFIDFLKEEAKQRRYYKIFAHNGGRFDYYFLKDIMSKSELAKANIRLRGTTIVSMYVYGHIFHDTVLYLPFSLSTLCDAFKLGEDSKITKLQLHGQTLTNEQLCFYRPELSFFEFMELRNSDPEFWELYTRYCLRDCTSLQIIWTRANECIGDIFKQLRFSNTLSNFGTIGSCSLALIRHCINPYFQKPKPMSDESIAKRTNTRRNNKIERVNMGYMPFDRQNKDNTENSDHTIELESGELRPELCLNAKNAENNNEVDKLAELRKIYVNRVPVNQINGGSKGNRVLVDSPHKETAELYAEMKRFFLQDGIFGDPNRDRDLIFVDRAKYDFICEFKRGGISFCNKAGKFNGGIICDDINSQYPAAMYYTDIPIGASRWYHNIHYSRYGDINMSLHGYYFIKNIEFTAKSPNFKCICGKNDNGTLNWNTGRQLAETYVDSWMLKDMIVKGYIKSFDVDTALLSSTCTTGTKLFGRYVTTLYKVKQQHDQYKNANAPEYNPVMRECIKLFLNSGNGKLIEDTDKYTKMSLTMLTPTDIVKRAELGYDNSNLKIIGTNVFCTQNVGKCNPFITAGTMVYSYSKRLLHEYARLLPEGPDSLIAVETDSICFESKYNDTFRENVKKYHGRMPIGFGVNLGNIKEEHNTTPVVKGGRPCYFLGKKCKYIYDDTKTSERDRITKTMKGVPSKTIDIHGSQVDIITENFYERLYHGEKNITEFTTLMKSFFGLNSGIYAAKMVRVIKPMCEYKEYN